MTKFIDLDREVQNEVITEASHQLGTFLPEILEKDVWVCHVLDVLFTLQGTPSLAFRGGTSLSKAYNAIDRFSEDIDITISHDEILPEIKSIAGLSKKKQKNMLEHELKDKVIQVLHEVFYPKLSESLGAFGTIDFDDYDKTGTTIRFTYQSCLEGIESFSPNLKRNVRLEFGGRSSMEPNSAMTITTYASEIFPQIFFPEPNVTVVSGSRTFWDKVTLIHCKITRRENSRLDSTERQSRHWYDLFRLLDHQTGRDALTKDLHLFEEVVNYKDLFFHDNPAKIRDCLSGSLRLAPHGELLDKLENDYNAMKRNGLFYNSPPSFNEITDRLRDFEKEVNGLMSL
ncbi:MAG: nucleotidyl transferase AbiEii/AbiGii toxin family protein [Synergistaceae bacterium]|jgi:predicted nucleotidyltransferase component of viral defense system|nr:nucleotidyl transferase AbiEii/AbiGii toxin family protein [Synergistaceae bacterium]